MTRLIFEPFEQLHRHSLEAHVGLHPELLTDSTGTFAGALRAQRCALENEDIDVALGELIGQRAAHDPASGNDYISAFHSPRLAARLNARRATTSPTPQRST